MFPSRVALQIRLWRRNTARRQRFHAVVSQVFPDALVDILTAEVSMLSIDFFVLTASRQLRRVLPSLRISACQSLLRDTNPADRYEFLFVPSTRYA